MTLFCRDETDQILRMPILFAIFAVVLSACVVGLIVLALAAILGNLRDVWKLERGDRDRRRKAIR